MPGPRWEGALQASAEAYQAAESRRRRSRFSVSPYAEHYQRIGTSLAEDSARLRPAPLRSGADRPVPSQALAADRPVRHRSGVARLLRRRACRISIAAAGAGTASPIRVVHDANCMMTWWRTDVFDEHGLPEPTTFEIILENAKKLNEKKATAGFMTCAATRRLVPRHDLYRHDACASAASGTRTTSRTPFGRIDPSKGSGKLLLDSPENVAAMTMLARPRRGLERGFAQRPGVRERRGLQERRLATSRSCGRG